MAELDAAARAVLPIHDRRHAGLTTYDAKERSWILLDDAGFGSSSSFGGPCRTPSTSRCSADRLITPERLRVATARP